MKKSLPIILVTFCCGIPLLWGQDADVHNVWFQDEGETIVIHYDLMGEPDQKYEIEVSLTHGERRNFPIGKKTLSGDVGRNVLSGRQKTIVWDMTKDYPKGLSGDAFQFAVSAKLQGKENKKIYGFNFGYGASSLPGMDTIDRSKMGFSFGGFGIFAGENSPVQWRVEANYTSKGGAGEEYEDEFTDKVNCRYHLNYLEIPVLLQTRIRDDQSKQFVFFGGPEIAFLLSGTEEMERWSGTMYSNLRDTESVKKTDWGIMAGAGYAFGKAMVSLRYTAGMQKAVGYMGNFEAKNQVISGVLSVTLR